MRELSQKEKLRLFMTVLSSKHQEVEAVALIKVEILPLFTMISNKMLQKVVLRDDELRELMPRILVLIQRMFSKAELAMLLFTLRSVNLLRT